MSGIGNCGCETRDGRTQSRRMEVSTKQLQIAELAATRPEESFTSLNHYLDMDWMKEAYRRTRRERAPGVDGQTMEEYGKELERHLQEMIGLAKSGRYHAPPVRRVHIPKGDGKETRPIGIPTCQDKVLQRAITMLLEPIYEQEFMECSFGFRPGRSAHDALQYLWKQCMDNQVRWILDVDIRSYFDTLDHAKLREIVSQRERIFCDDRSPYDARGIQSGSVIFGERICGGSLITSCSARWPRSPNSRRPPSPSTSIFWIPGVDRSMAEFEESRLKWSWILIGTSRGGGRD